MLREWVLVIYITCIIFILIPTCSKRRQERSNTLLTHQIEWPILIAIKNTI